MTTEKSWDVSYEWKAMLVLSLAFGLVGIDRFILPPLFGPMMKDLNLNYQNLGDLVGALAIAWGASAFLTGLLSDHLGRRSVLVPSVIIFSVLSALSGMATGLVSLLVIRIVMGVFEGPVASTGVAVSVEASHPKRRGMNNGIFQCTVSLFGSGVGPILATQLLLITTWRHVFWIVGAPGLVVAVILWFVIREPAALAAQRGTAVIARASFWSLFKHRNVPLAMVTLLCAMTGIFVLSAMVPNYLTDYVKLPGTQMGFVTSAIGFGGALGQFGLLTVSDFIGRRVATVLSFVIASVFLWLFIHGGANPRDAVWPALRGIDVQLRRVGHPGRTHSGRSGPRGPGGDCGGTGDWRRRGVWRWCCASHRRRNRPEFRNPVHPVLRAGRPDFGTAAGAVPA